jgi:transposase-like protein/DNA-directed RNA polymerase subunit RPC12/RpoP
MLQTDLHSFSYKKGSLVPWCKKCGADRLRGDGKTKQNLPRYRCKQCNFRGVWTSDLPRRNVFSSVISFAVELYTSLRMAASLRGVKVVLQKIFNVVVSYETIRQWVLTTKKPFSRRENSVPTHWHADETYIKIKGVGHWLWIVYCADTKQVLAWNLTKTRLFKDAKKLMQDALHVAGARPEKITTDGLYQYAAAIKKVMGWHWRIYRKKHLVDSGIGKNAVIERVNREVKRRVKWFSTFQSVEGANAFFSHWFHHWNQSTPPG